MSGPVESPIQKMKFNFSALNSSNKKLNGYNITGHCGKFLWIRIALLEKLLRKIVEDLQTNARLEEFSSLLSNGFSLTEISGTIQNIFCQTDHLDKLYTRKHTCTCTCTVTMFYNIDWKLMASYFFFSVVLKWHQKPPDLSTRQCSKINIFIIMLSCKTKVSCYPHVYNLGKHFSRICKKYEAAGLYYGCKQKKNMSINYI